MAEPEHAPDAPGPAPAPAPATPGAVAPAPGAEPVPARGDASRPPALRASDADRERTANLLREAGGDGRLAVHELDERLDAAYAAVTRADLQGLTADLVAAPGQAPAPAGRPGRVVVRGGDSGTRWLVAVMSGIDRAGTWRLARRCTSISVMGGADLDLTHAEFDGEDVHLRVVCVMGGSDIRVPDHMNVSVSNLAIMGGNDVRIGHGTPDPGGPTLHLHLVSIMGGSTVERGPKRSRRERRAERERRRAEREEERRRHRIDRHG